MNKIDIINNKIKYISILLEMLLYDSFGHTSKK